MPDTLLRHTPQMKISPRLAMLAAAASLSTAACGGDGPSLPPLDASTARMTVVSGDAQQDSIGAQLAQPIVVRLTDDQGNLRSGVLINFVVVEPNCGAPFAGSATTGANGEAIERWNLGTKAGTCHMEARAVDQKTGAPLVFKSITATIQPGRPDTADFLAEGPTFRNSGGVHAVPLFVGGANFDLSLVRMRVADRAGNAIASPGARSWRALDAGAAVGGGPNGAVVTATQEGLQRLVVNGVSRSDTMRVFGVMDLRQARWNAEWTCRGGSIRTERLAGPFKTVDSVRMSLVADSVSYGLSGSVDDRFETIHIPGSNVASYTATFWGTIGFTIWWRDGQVQVNDPRSPVVVGAWAYEGFSLANRAFTAHQYPGAMNLMARLPAGSNNRPEWVVTAQPGAPAVFVGGAAPWCLEGMLMGNTNLRIAPRP